MIPTRALTLRLAIFLVAGQFISYVLTLVGHLALNMSGAISSPESSWNDFASGEALQLIERSLVSGPDGSARIEPTVELRDLAARTPTLKFAAFDPKTNAALPGSSDSLVAALEGRDRTATLFLNFRISGEVDESLRGVETLADTPFGKYALAAYGYRFAWKYVAFDLYQDVVRVFKQMIPMFCVTILVGWITLRRGLRPLHKAADQARHIDAESLYQRLPEDEMPVEVAPFVAAINDALARVDAGVARQRRFNANAAHELRTPIAILVACVETIHDDRISCELRRHLDHLQNIVEQLLVSARLSGKTPRNEEALDFAALVLAKVADYTPLIMENGRDIDFEGPSSGVMVRGDRRALESVVANLVDNALRAEPKGGTVLVRLTTGASLEVIDHGEGVDESDRTAIFEPFWRKSEAMPGTGLGLAIVKEIVELHGGRISVRETPGGGATFTASFQSRRRVDETAMSD